jgi:hypothetical protein
MLYDLLKESVKEDEQFLVDWESFRGFNSKQILGLAACSDPDKVLAHIRTL